MKYCYITFRSVTYAQRSERLLQQKGIRCNLLRTPRWMEEQGCGYCLRLQIRDGSEAVSLLREHQMPLRKTYIQMFDGQLEETVL